MISALVVRSILKGSLSLPYHSAPSEECCTEFVRCMQEGNRLYDGSGLGGQHTSIYTALDLLPNDVGIAAKGDIGIRNNADCATVFARGGKLAQEKVLNIAGVLVHHPYSFALLFCHLTCSIRFLLSSILLTLKG